MRGCSRDALLAAWQDSTNSVMFSAIPCAYACGPDRTSARRRKTTNVRSLTPATQTIHHCGLAPSWPRPMDHQTTRPPGDRPPHLVVAHKYIGNTIDGGGMLRGVGTTRTCNKYRDITDLLGSCHNIEGGIVHGGAVMLGNDLLATESATRSERPHWQHAGTCTSGWRCRETKPGANKQCCCGSSVCTHQGGRKAGGRRHRADRLTSEFTTQDTAHEATTKTSADSE